MIEEATPEAPEVVEPEPTQDPVPNTEGRSLTIVTDGNGYTANWTMGLLEMEAILRALHAQITAKLANRTQ